MSNFETWWEREGQEFLFALNTTTDDDIKLVAEVAWKNGAYCAEQAEQEPVACYPCEIVTADFDENTVTVEMMVDHYQVSAGTKYLCDAAPVRTKDLTDDEIYKLADDVDWAAGAYLGFARAVIAADREKNKCQH